MKRITFVAIAMFSLLAAVAQSDSVKFQNTIRINPDDTRETIKAKAAHVVPTANQMRALQNEFIAFIHMGPNTFTQKEWGNGFEETSVFALKDLNTDQWCEAMREAGIKMVILTAKHHDGFVMWQSRYTKHGIMSTEFRDGQGDVLKDLAASCKKYGLKLGVYLSPADLYQIEAPDGLYGNLSKPSMRTIPRQVEGRPFENKTSFQFEVDDYNEYFLNQLFEVLTEYGPVDEVWFDGAHPKTKGGQTYNYQAWKELIHKLAPNAVIFGRQDVRWCGNEAGATRPTEWNVVPYDEDPATATNFPDITSAEPGVMDKLMKAKYLHYQQAETNTSIREGWFYRDDTRQRVRSTDDVFDIYERSVGGNSTFLLNIPPNREGLFSPRDVKVLREVGQRIEDTYGVNLLGGAAVDKIADTVIVATMDQPVTINRVVLQEDIANSGERVENHAVDAWIDGAWQEVAQATNIGYKRILRFPEVTTDRLRVRILRSRATPTIDSIAAHYYRSRPPQLNITRDDEGRVVILPAKDDFAWKSHGHNATANLNVGIEIHYTTDGSAPDSESAKLYVAPFAMDRGEVRAVATKGAERGAEAIQTLGYIKHDWKVTTQDGVLTIDLGKSKTLQGFSYTPKNGKSDILSFGGTIEVSANGKQWQKIATFEFGNLKNDPTKRSDYFKHKDNAPISARFVRVVSNDKSLNVSNVDFY